MKKRILSIVLAVLMLVGIMPISAIDADGSGIEAPTETTPVSGVSANSEDNAVHVTKSVSEDGKTLTLEAYATNTMTTVTTYEPLDIVLVLDVSGSMDNCINCDATWEDDQWSNGSQYCSNQPSYEYRQKGLAKNLNESAGTLYRVNAQGRYSEVYWCDGDHLWGHSAGWYYGIHDRVSDNTMLYEQVALPKTEHQHRIAALRTAVNAFIDSVANQKDSEGNAIANRISIVKFAGQKIKWTGSNEGNETYMDGWHTYNNSQVVKGLTVASTGKDALKNAVNGLSARGATRADYGMQLAESVLTRRTETKPNKSVVIMFTDGEPTSGNEFENKVASAAIAAAKALKTGGTTVFTVGIFEGANPAADPGNDNTNKYMHAMSSNYPNATYDGAYYGFHYYYSWNFDKRAEGNYYLAASDANGLNAVFQAISNQVGSLAVKVDETSVLSDTLSDMFDFNAPENAEYSGITVAKYPVTGMENGVYTWGDAQELAIGEGEDKVQVEVDGKKLEVTGFDYGKNAVTTKTEGETTTYSGYKLVVTIPIKPDTEYHGWADGEHYYDTNSIANDSKAGLEYGETGSRQKLELNDSPEAPVTAYTVSYTYTDATNAPTSVEAPKDDTAYIAGQTADVIEQTPTSVTENGYAYTFGGWKIGGEPAGTTIPITDHNVTITGKWTKTALTATVTITKEFVAPEGVANFEVPTGLTLKLVPNDTSKDPIPLTQVEGESRYTASGVPAGTYTLVEENETVDGYTCNSMLTKTGTTPDLNNDGTITVAADGTYTYNLTNTYTENPTTATVVITKKLAGVPEGTSVPAGLEIYLSKDGQTVVGPQTADTTGGDTFTITGLTAGTYEIGESKYDIDGYDWKSSSSEGFKIVAADYGTTKNVELTNTYAEKELEPVKNLKVTKSADKQKGKVGEMITYTIEVKNTGNVDLENITLTDTFDGTGTLYEDMGKNKPVERNVNNEFTVEVGALDVGAYQTYTYYYWIDERDEGVVTNVAVAASGDVEGSDHTETEVDRGDVDGFKVVGWIEKIVESKKGTFKKYASFTFDIWADKDCTVPLGTVTISEEWAATKDWYDEKTKPFFFEISENVFKELKTKDGHEVIYVTEREGDIKGMTYDSDVVMMYLVPEDASAYSLHIGDHYFATADLSYGNHQPAEFTNVYKKPAEKGETIKVGPQLNRDDHVAYIMGYPDGTVQPEGEITRAEACTIFFRLLTDSSRDYYFARTNDYSDVNAGDWFNNAISTLSNAGIVTGYNDGTFRPNQPITRGEMAKIIANFANLNKGTKSFTDLSGHWSKTYVELAAGNGWIAGYPDGSFRPDQKITRAETVTMINRVLDRVPAKESRLLSRSIMLTFPDNNPGDWYYIAIQEASNSHEYRRSVYETTGDEMWTKLIDNVDWTKLEK